MTDQESGLTIMVCSRGSKANEPSKPKFKCVHCKTYFDSSKNWKSHMTEAHPAIQSVGEE